MNGHGRQLLAAIALLAFGGSALGCGGSDERKGNHEIWFMGSIYDGATGAVLNGYTISLTYGPTTVTGKIDANGRYTLGPLQAWNDYAVTITLDGYRAFTSYNAGISPPAPPTTSQAADVYDASTMQTFDFDAYLFPSSIQSSALTINILKADPMAAPPDGNIRLRPSSQSSIQDSVGGVGNQVWSNDQDVLAAVINNPFYGGSIVIDPGTLVYGVTYQVTVYGVDGYQPGTATVRGGLQDNVIVNISTTASPLLIVSNTMAQCRPYGQSTNVVMTAQISFMFNTASVEDVTPASVGRAAEVLDNGLAVMTALGATLKPNASLAVQEHGTTFNLSGNMLTIAWNPSVGLNTSSATDTINYVNYGSLSGITLQPTGHPELAKTLSTLLNGSTSIYCAN